MTGTSPHLAVESSPPPAILSCYGPGTSVIGFEKVHAVVQRLACDCSLSGCALQAIGSYWCLHKH